MNEVGTILKIRILIPEVPVQMDEVAIATQDFKKSALNNKYGSRYLDQNNFHSMKSFRKLHLLEKVHPAVPSPHAMTTVPFVKE